MCRFLPPPGRHHFGSPHGRYFQICEIRNFFEEVQFFSKIKILENVSIFAASGTASFRVPAWPVFPDFWNSLIFQIQVQKVEMLNSWWMCRILLPPGRHHFRSPHGRYLQIFETQWFFKKLQKVESLKSWWMCRIVPPPGRHHFGSSHGGSLRFIEIHWFFQKSSFL